MTAAANVGAVPVGAVIGLDPCADRSRKTVTREGVDWSVGWRRVSRCDQHGEERESDCGVHYPLFVAQVRIAQTSKFETEFRSLFPTLVIRTKILEILMTTGRLG